LPDNVKVVITGSHSDQRIANNIKSHSENNKSIVIAAGEVKRLGQTGALIKGAIGVVTGDTSILHISSALNIPTVAIYGSTRPNEYTPLFGKNVLLYDENTPCAPCYSSSCALTGKKHLKCLKAVTAESVLDKLQQITDDFAVYSSESYPIT
jgi:ADP-heptose:LPS heptosyltransferase